eukprot:3094069-Amphidinium_carterae.2
MHREWGSTPSCQMPREDWKDKPLCRECEDLPAIKKPYGEPSGDPPNNPYGDDRIARRQPKREEDVKLALRQLPKLE